jgi:hypothetical protein
MTLRYAAAFVARMFADDVGPNGRRRALRYPLA